MRKCCFMETFSNISNSEKLTASLNIYRLSIKLSRMIWSLLLLTKSDKIYEYAYKLNQNLLKPKICTSGLLTNEKVSFTKIICHAFYFHLSLFIQFNLLSPIVTVGGTSIARLVSDCFNFFLSLSRAYSLDIQCSNKKVLRVIFNN